MNRKSYLRRLLVIYVAFFGILITSFAVEVIPSFTQGLKEGTELGTELSEVYDAPEPRSIYMLWNIPIRRAESITICAQNPDREVTGLLSNLTLQVEEPAASYRSAMQLAFAAIGNSPWIYALMILSALTYPVVVVLMFLIIRSVRRSLREDKPLEHCNALLLRAIALLTILGEVFDSVGMWMMTHRAAEVLSTTAYEVDTTFRLNFGMLVLGLLLLFAAEMFKIGHDLSEEQRLTI